MEVMKEAYDKSQSYISSLSSIVGKTLTDKLGIIFDPKHCSLCNGTRGFIEKKKTCTFCSYPVCKNCISFEAFSQESSKMEKACIRCYFSALEEKVKKEYIPIVEPEEAEKQKEMKEEIKKYEKNLTLLDSKLQEIHSSIEDRELKEKRLKQEQENRIAEKKLKNQKEIENLTEKLEKIRKSNKKKRERLAKQEKERKRLTEEIKDEEEKLRKLKTLAEEDLRLSTQKNLENSENEKEQNRLILELNEVKKKIEGLRLEQESLINKRSQNK